MSMEFRVYQLPIAENLTDDDDQLFGYIQGIGKIPGEFRFNFCITNESNLTDHVLTFCFSEEHAPDISSVDDDNNSYVLQVSPYVNTIMAIDLREKRFLVQNRDYPPQTLNKDQTMARIGTLLNRAFQEVYHVDFNRLTTDRPVPQEELKNLFERYRVSLLRVNISNERRFIPDNEIVFGEDEHLNTSWIEGWNTDQSQMYEILLKAPGRGGEGDLRESPISRSLIRTIGANIVQLNYWDEENRLQKVSTETLKRFVVEDIDQHTQPITSVDRVSNAILRRREELREYRAINDL